MEKKRIVTRIGNVFCVEIDGLYKCYFQFIAIDSSQLGSSVIRVFKKRYPLETSPKIDEIIKGEVAFYAHTVLRAGIEERIWYKVGNSNNIIKEVISQVLFGYCCDYKSISITETLSVNPRENWWIWNVNTEQLNIGNLPPIYRAEVEPGDVFPYDYIICRIKCGYYKHTSSMYYDIPRHPWPDAHSYLKTEEGGVVVYYHFLGENVLEQLIVDGEKRVHLTTEAPTTEGYTLRTAPFYTTNWKYPEFIEQNEFDEAWRRE